MGINRFKISYTYDPLNRLSSVAVNGETKKYYGYDRAGNLVRISPDPLEKPGASDQAKGTGKTGGPAKGNEPAPGKKPVAGGGRRAPGRAAVRDERFAALEEEYERLNMEAQAGSIFLEQFQEEVNRLRFQDAAGTWWQLRYDGAWLKWEGAAWVEGNRFPG